MLRVAEHFAKSDTGRQRRANEDSLLARTPVFVVADGMGGAKAGEIASRMAVEAFAPGLPDGGTPEERLADAAREANARIHELASADRERAGMGTTLTAVYVGEEELAIAQVGDSRAYVLREGELSRLTRDHSLVEELIRSGKITEEEAPHHPQRSIITRALGPAASVEVDTRSYRGHDGDVILICSDGLTSMIDEGAVGEILRSASSLDAAGQRLVSEANEAGGRDNITVVLLRLEQLGHGEDGARAEQSTGTAPAVSPTTADPVATPAGTATATVAERRLPRAAPAVVVGGKRRRLRGRPAAALLATLIVVGLLGFGGWLASRSVFFVGTSPQGLVTVFRGLPYDLPAGVRLYERYFVSGVPAASLPARQRKDLLDHRLRSHDDATGLVSQLELGKLSP